MNARVTVMNLAAALCAVAGLAAAQDAGQCSKPCDQPAEQGATHELTLRPLVAGQPVRLVSQPESRVQSRTVMVESDGEHEYKVEINDDVVKAWIDGERVPSERVKVSDDRITLLGEDGKKVKEFSRSVETVVVAPKRQLTIRGEDDGPIVWEGQGRAPMALGVTVQPEDHPPVMIGINMGSLEGDVDEEVLDTLSDHDLDTEEAIVVMGVVDGLPADKAGVREGDVILRIDGEWGATPESLREVLMEKEPGDTIELLVIRDGERKEIEITLAPYDTEKLGQTVTIFGEAEDSAPFVYQGFGVDKEAMQELLKQLQEHRGELDEEVQRLVERLSRQEFERFRELDELPRFRIYREDGGPAPRALVTPAVPGVPAAPWSPDAARAQQERLDSIEKRLDRIEKRLDRVLEALESRERDR